MASVCRDLDLDVTVAERGPAPLSGPLGGVIGRIAAEMQRKAGVDLRTGVSVLAMEGDAGGHVRRARLSDDSTLDVDVVVTSLGSIRNIEWLDGAGLAAGPWGVGCDAVDWQRPAELREVPVPEPGPSQVLVKVGGAGACHSDLHILDMPKPSGELAFSIPFTLGHENAGWVEKLGPGTTGFALGDPVIVYGPWGCGLCMNCLAGHGELLPTAGRSGGWRPLGPLVPAARYLIPLGASVGATLLRSATRR